MTTQSKNEVIAVGGRGGSGKTTISAIMAKIFAAANKKVLVVDADPPADLAFSLGVDPKGKTIGAERKKLGRDPEEKRRIANRHMRDIISEEFIINVNGISLLVMGRAEGPGCYCAINELLKYGIESLSKMFEITIVDCEAGIEQVNRRVLAGVTTMIMVSDTTQKGIRTASYMKEIAESYGVEESYKIGLVLNKMRKDREEIKEKAREMGLEIFGVIPEEEDLSRYGLTGKPIIELPDNSPSVVAVGKILKVLGLNL
ncbi:MAG: AAA family ATPase [Desulfobacteraceae bacterium]|nr:AAA family ATPase [Desulfobacteraceae bacterium]MBC2755410.1 AAA family ATPase [Desulfobacteraceae bacterium]